MKKHIITLIGVIGISIPLLAQEIIPLDTTHWQINAQSYMLESFRGSASIYLQGGSITYKGEDFLNGSIEYDIFLKEEQAFPGVYFRAQGSDSEHFYIRPHLPNKPDGNQAVPVTKGITPWQLYFGPRYSFPYPYRYDDWTHVKVLVNGDRAQVFLDHSERPHLSWNLFHPTRRGAVILSGGNRSGMHIANISIDHTSPDLVNFQPIEREAIEGLVPAWELSDKFDEARLDDPADMATLIKERTWGHTIIKVEEGTAANISRAVQRRGQGAGPGNTVFARITVRSDQKQMKQFHFGYSDRAVVICNGTPLYRGSNNYRSRDYRYLGTIGLFDSVYLPLKKGENTILIAVSENFGGWLVTGKFEDASGIVIQ